MPKTEKVYLKSIYDNALLDSGGEVRHIQNGEHHQRAYLRSDKKDNSYNEHQKWELIDTEDGDNTFYIKNKYNNFFLNCHVRCGHGVVYTNEKTKETAGYFKWQILRDNSNSDGYNIRHLASNRYLRANCPGIVKKKYTLVQASKSGEGAVGETIWMKKGW